MKMGKGDHSDKNPKITDLGVEETRCEGDGYYGYVPYVADGLVTNSSSVALMSDYNGADTDRVTVTQNDNGSVIINKSPVRCAPEQLEMMLTEEELAKKLNRDDDGAAAVVRDAGWNMRAMLALIILLITNLLNYMDRYTIAGVLVQVKDYYNVQSDGMAGLIQTSFIISYMLLSPIFGYLGDRYNRKLIMACGIFFWSLVTLAGSFVPKDMFYTFLLMRALVGVGEASYSTIAPTLIADLFVKNMRTKALSVFYFAIPVGSGLGYIVGSYMAKLFGAWQWALRVTPVFGVICVVLILVVVREPERGAAEGSVNLHSTNWSTDIWFLLKHKSFMLTTMGFTCVAFVAGALSLWGPTYVYYSMKAIPGAGPVDEAGVSLIFGIITCLAGIIGVVSGSAIAARLRSRFHDIDPLVCAAGLLGSAPFLFLAICFSRHNVIVTWVFIFIGETLLCLNWALVTDIVLYIIIPTRRSTAEALQILVCHALGDAGSPYLVGLTSDAIAHHRGNTGFIFEDFITLQYALYMTCFVSIIGAGFFFLCSLFIQKDRLDAEKLAKELMRTPAEASTEGSSQCTTLAPTPNSTSQPSFHTEVPT